MRGKIKKNRRASLLKNYRSRNTIIRPFMLRKRFYVLNGRFVFTLRIKREMLWFKLGEFVYTRRRGYTRVERQKRKIKGTKKKLNKKVKKGKL